jgi:hypothetical protein
MTVKMTRKKVRLHRVMKEERSSNRCEVADLVVVAKLIKKQGRCGVPTACTRIIGRFTKRRMTETNPGLDRYGIVVVSDSGFRPVPSW